MIVIKNKTRNTGNVATAIWSTASWSGPGPGPRCSPTPTPTPAAGKRKCRMTSKHQKRKSLMDDCCQRLRLLLWFLSPSWCSYGEDRRHRQCLWSAIRSVLITYWHRSQDTSVFSCVLLLRGVRGRRLSKQPVCGWGGGVCLFYLPSRRADGSQEGSRQAAAGAGLASPDPTDCWFNNSSKHQSRVCPLQRTTLIKHGWPVSVLKERQGDFSTCCRSSVALLFFIPLGWWSPTDGRFHIHPCSSWHFSSVSIFSLNVNNG